MLNTHNRQLLKLSQSLTSSTRPSPSLSQRHTLGGARRGMLGVGGSTFSGVLVQSATPTRLPEEGRTQSAVGIWMAFRGLSPCATQPGRPIFPHDLRVARRPLNITSDPHYGLKKRLYSAGLERGEKSGEATQPEGGA